MYGCGTAGVRLVMPASMVLVRNWTTCAMIDGCFFMPDLCPEDSGEVNSKFEHSVRSKMYSRSVNETAG